MDLERKAFPGIEQLDQDGEAGGRMGFVGGAKDLPPLLGPKLMEGDSPLAAEMDNALGILTIHDFPRFSHRRAIGKGFMEEGL